MPKLITGFLIGVVSTIAVFYVVDRTPRDAVDGRTDVSEATRNVAGADRVATGSQSALSVSEEGKDERIPKPGESITGPQISVPQTASVGASEPDAAAPGSAAVPSQRTTKDVYSPEIADILEKSVPKELQSQYESEEKELSWATYMEGQFANYFAQKAELSQYNISLIDCRTSICEIHALGYGPDAFAVWNTAVADITHQPWHEFGRMSASAKEVQPDVLGIVLILAENAD